MAMVRAADTCAFQPLLASRFVSRGGLKESRKRTCKRRRSRCPLEVNRVQQAKYDDLAYPRMRSERPDESICDNERIENEHAEFRKEHSQIPGIPPLPPTPEEVSGFEGWREQDDAYWRAFRAREVAFRAPTTSSPDDFDLAPQPLDRNGNPVTYAAAIKYCHKTEQWIPTTVEEEKALREPAPVEDPYYVREALPREPHTSLRDESHSDINGNESEQSEVYFEGALEFSQPLVRDMSPHRRKRLNLAPGGWRVVHLGTSSAVPTSKRNVSCTAVVMRHFDVKTQEPSMFLVDAGENSDHQLIQCEWCMTHGFRWIRAIFITHLHGDHVYGLPGLLASIGEYAQHRRRRAVDNGDDGSDPIVRVFGPFGTRGFLRASLYWTNPVGVRFSVAELVPRETDFAHFRASLDGGWGIFAFDPESGEIMSSADSDLTKQSPPPHPEEVRTDDVYVGEDGLWHVWQESDHGVTTEVVAAPLKHRMPCFGYVFRELKQPNNTAEDKESGLEYKGRYREGRSTRNGAVSAPQESQGIEIDREKARRLGVHGTQYRVLRSGRSVTVSRTGLVVTPEDVAQDNGKQPDGSELVTQNLENRHLQSEFRRKVTILGDTCDSSAIAQAAMNSDLLIHEATFTDKLKVKARKSMHSTARMAGEFARRIHARKVALTHFSSRYEYLQHLLEDRGRTDAENHEAEIGNDDIPEIDEMLNTEEGLDEDEDLASPNELVLEALWGYGDDMANIVAARDFMEHDIVAAGETDDRSSASSVITKLEAQAEVQKTVSALKAFRSLGSSERADV